MIELEVPGIDKKSSLFWILAFLVCFSCTDTKKGDSNPANLGELPFDKTKWSAKEDLDYLYRDQMLNDVVYTDTLRMLNKDGVLELLGEPDQNNAGYLYYRITQKRLGFWTLHTKSLVIKLSDDNRVEWIKIHE